MGRQMTRREEEFTQIHIVLKYIFDVNNVTKIMLTYLLDSTMHLVFAKAALGRCQTRNKVEQLCHSTFLRDKVACLTSQVAQPLISRATNLPDRNHLYSSAISRSVAELSLVNCLFTCELLILL